MEIASYGSVRDSEICRTCLVELVDDSKIFYLDSVISTVDKTTIRHKLRDCIPELDLNVTPNAAICFDCLFSLNTSHNFKKKCLQAEKNIKRFARRMGSIFVDLAQLVEQNKKSNLYPDIHPVEIKQEPGISESHTYTRFFVKQEPLDVTDVSNDDDSYCDDYSLDSSSIKEECVDAEYGSRNSLPTPNIIKNVAIKQESDTILSNNVKLPSTPPNNICKKNVKQLPSPPPLNPLPIPNHAKRPVEKLKPDIKKKIIGNCAISLQEIPKTKNNVIPAPQLSLNFKTVHEPTTIKKSEDIFNNLKVECKKEPTNKLSQPIDSNSHLDIKTIKLESVNNGEIKKSESQRVDVHIKKEQIPLKPQARLKRKPQTKLPENPPAKLVVSNNILKGEPSNLVYAILTLVKPGESLPNKVNSILSVQPKIEATPSVTQPVVKKEHNSVVEKPLPFLTTQQPLPVCSPPPLAQISEPPKVVKIEPKPVEDVTSPTETANNLGYNIDLNNLPPLAPLSENLPNFDDGITHLECTPNIDDYVNDDLDDDDVPHKCNDCEFETRDKLELEEHINAHIEQKYDIKPELPTIKKRDLFGRIKTLGGKLVYECPICNYRTGLKRRYLFHKKLHEENKLLKCTQCDYLCATKSNLNVHMAVHTGHKPHKCTDCGYSTVSKSALLVHTRIHTGDRPYSCGVCGYCTISKSALIVHNRIHTGSKPYRCPTCNYRTITKSSLTVHMRTHTGDKPFKCHLCEYSTRAKSALNVHVRIHEGYKPYQCTECEYRCSQRSGLNVHMRVHTGDKPFQCTECDYKCSSKSSLVVHHRTHTGETPYKCDECDYTTAWKSALNVHSRIHGDRKPFRCTECDYKCAQRSTLNVHMRIHTGDKPYQCSECEYRCRYQGNLKMHMRIHSRETPFKCEICNYSTTAKSALIVHHRIHTGEKPFKCNECPYKCSTKSSLKIHNRIHTGETPYECKRCLYKASSNSALKVHLRIHTGEKPFKCSYCSYRASNKGSIKVHLRVHTGETPYECSICDYKTTAKSALIVHMRIHTGDKPYKCEECSYRCNNKSSLKVHLKVHTGRTPYRCEICDYRCKKKFVLKRHLGVHRKEQADTETGDANEDEPSTPEPLGTIKSEVDDSMVDDEQDELVHDDEGEGEMLIGSGYEGDLDVSNIKPEFSVVAV